MSEEISVKRIQSIELKMLSELSEILTKNQIPFFLAWGTALGCVRHQGFIPWDDDIDIYIYGRDYPKLRKVFSEQNTGNLALHDYSTKPGYPYVFPKIVDTSTVLKEREFSHLDYLGGVYIDVFPLFQVSDNVIKHKIDKYIRYMRYGIVKANYMAPPKGFAKRILQALSRLLPISYIQKKLFSTYTTSDGKGSMVTEPLVFSEHHLFKADYFSEPHYMSFENLRMPISPKYHDYLKDAYGDYMQLPPEGNRHSNHDFFLLELND